MKDYRDMLSSLKDKVVDAAGKAGETVTNAANKVARVVKTNTAELKTMWSAEAEGKVTTWAQVRAGWPDERIRDGAAQNRVYTAVWALRRMGLGDRLRRTPGGYLLDPTIAIVDAPAGDGPRPAT